MLSNTSVLVIETERNKNSPRMNRPRRVRPEEKRDNVRSSLFSNSSRERGRAISTLKLDRKYGQIREVLNSLPPNFRDDIFGRNLAPQSWDAIEGEPPLPQSTSWIQELGWLSFSIELGSQYLNHFLSLRQRFGHAFIAGAYGKAEAILNDTQQLFGLSYWLLERRLMIAQATGGFDGNKSQLQEILKTCGDPFVRYAATVFSSRVETAVSATKFQEQIEGKAAEIRASGSDNLASKIEFQLAPWSCGWAHANHRLLQRCQRRSLIDLYNYSLKILCYACSEATPQEADFYHLQKILHGMYAAVPDKVTLHLLQLIGAVPEESTLDDESLEVIRVHDLLITQRGGEAFDVAKALLKENPLSFDNYYLLSQSIVATGLSPGKLFGEDSFAQKIVERLPLALGNQGNIRPHLDTLIDIASKLGDNHIGLAIGMYVIGETHGTINPLMRKYVGLIGKNSLAGTLQNFPIDASPLRIRQLVSSAPDGPSTILLKHHSTGQGDLAKLNAIVDPVVLDLFESQALFDIGDFRTAVDRLSSRLRGEQILAGCAQLFAPRIAEKLFTGRLALAHYAEAAEDVIFVAARNKNFLRHVSFEDLISHGNEVGGEEMKRAESWPVLHYLDSRSAQEIYRALRSFLNEHAFNGPLGYVEGISAPISDAQRFLLRDILVPQVIERGWRWVSSDDELRNVRAQVLQKLFETSAEDQELVLGQLSTIEQERAIEEEYRNIEGPKFFFDFAELHRRLLNEHGLEFERYLMFKSFENAGGEVVDQEDLFSAVVRSQGSGEKERPSGEGGLSPAQSVLLQIANGCFVSYLWGPQSSLNSMLGTRVRHGALENQLARAFDSADLLAKTTDGESYHISAAVEARIERLPEDQQEKVSTAVIVFSKKMYDMIENLVSNMMRIRVPTVTAEVMAKQGYSSDCFSEDGLLNFSPLFEISSTRDLICGEGLDTASAFLNKCRKVFEAAAHQAFWEVQSYLDSVVAPHVAEISETIEAEIHDIADGEEALSLLANDFAVAKDAFGGDIRIVNEWFSISENLEEISGSVQSIIDMAFRVVNFASSGGLGNFVNEGIAGGRIEGIARLMFYDVLLIVFRNIVKHAPAVQDQLVRVSLSIDPDAGSYSFKCINKVMSLPLLRHAIEEAKRCRDEREVGGVLARGPGKTGIRRIPELLNNLSDVPTRIEVSGDEESTTFQIQIDFSI